MLIYQISTEDKKNLFDFIITGMFNSREDLIQNYKQQLGDNLDANTLNQRTEFFNSFDYLIIDREAFYNNDRSVLLQLKGLKSFISKPRLIIIWRGMEEDLKKELIEENIKNLIIAETLDEQKIEIKECFSENGMQRYGTNWKTSKNENFEKYIFDSLNMYAIQFLTIDNSLKCKSIALSLCLYINSIGGSVNYYAPYYSDNTISNIAKLINAEEQDEYYIKDNNYNFMITDIGFVDDVMFNAEKENIIDERYDKNIILCDLNILEIDTIKDIFNSFNKNVYIANSSNKKIDINTLNLTGIDKEFFDNLDKKLKIKEIYKQDEIIDIRTNRNFFYSLIEPQIKATNKEE